MRLISRSILRTRSFYLLLGVLATLPQSWPLGRLGASSLQIPDLLLACLYGSLLLDFIRRRLTLRFDRLAAAAVLFLGALVVSLAVSGNGGYLRLAGYAAYLFLPWLMTQLIRDRHDLMLAVKAFLLGLLVAVVIAYLSMLHFFLLDRSFLRDLGCISHDLAGQPRVCLPFRNPNLLADYLTAGLALLIVFGTSFWKRSWVVAFVVATSVVALYTFSTGIAGLLIAVAVIFRLRSKGTARRWAGAALVVALFLALLASISTVGRVVPESGAQVRLGSAPFHFAKNARAYIWITVWDSVGERPWTGHGYGSLPGRTYIWDAYWHRSPLMLAPAGPTDPADAHNVLLSVTSQAGILGLAAFLILIGVPLVRAVRSLRDRDPVIRKLAVATVAAIAGTLGFHGLFMAGEEARHLWALLGFAALLGTIPRDQSPDAATTPAAAAARNGSGL